MRIWIVTGLLLAMMLMGACARSPRAVSYVFPSISSDEIEAISADATRHLVQMLPPAHTTLLLVPAKSKVGGELSHILIGHLRVAGYGVVEADARGRLEDVPATIPLRYLVSRLPDGIVLHLHYQGKLSSRFYPRGMDGGLRQAPPFAVREVL